MSAKEKLIRLIMTKPDYVKGFVKSLGKIGYNLAYSVLSSKIGVELERVEPILLSNISKTKICKLFQTIYHCEFTADYAIYDGINVTRNKISNAISQDNILANYEFQVLWSNTWKQLPYIKRLLEDTQLMTMSGSNGGIHIHIDLILPPDTKYKLIYKQRLDKIVNCLFKDVYKYKGKYNQCTVEIETKSSAINIRVRQETCEFRIGHANPTYTEFMYWVLNSIAAVKYAETNNINHFNQIYSITTKIMEELNQTVN
jgi:hypothetical protein